MSTGIRKRYAAGNWKMNTDLAGAQALAQAIVNGHEEALSQTGAEIILAVPFPFLGAVKAVIGGSSTIHLAAQNMNAADKGAFTGEISGSMLVSVGCTHVLIGHSERRQLYGETNASLSEKVKAAIRHGLTPVYCFGETLEQREKGMTFEVVEDQLREGLFGLPSDDFSKVLLAYEPVWAIGTGKTATPEQAQEVHSFVRGKVFIAYGREISKATTILYGGSVTASNAQQLFACPDIDGGLVGGASLKAEDFLEIAGSFL